MADAAAVTANHERGTSAYLAHLVRAALEGGAPFLRQVNRPHLLVITPDAALLTSTFDTISLAPGVRRRAVRVVPIAKRPGANPFGQMVTLGRAANNDIVIEDPGVSKFHAYLREERGAWSITDPGSLNGTRAGGQRLVQGRPRAVADGLELRLGDTVAVRFLEPPSLYRLMRTLGDGGHGALELLVAS